MKDLAVLFRRYEPYECGPDGYPYAWHEMTIREPRASGMEMMWPAIKDYVREQAGHRCLRCGHPYPPGIAKTNPGGEWTPCDEHCTHGQPFRVSQPAAGWWEPNNRKVAGWHVSEAREHGWPEPVVCAHWRILTVHHLDEDKANCRWWNLAALCQRCHLRMQRAVVMGRPYHYEHSDWFKPYAAGFYAWKYEGLELSREATMARLDELLAHELQFRQEALF